MEADNEVAAGPIRSVLAAIAMGLGLILVLCGIWALGGAIYFAWELFQEPDSISYFARYILETTQVATLLQTGGQGLAHFLSWVAVILLLLVLGKLGAWAVGAGASLMSARGR